MAPGPLVGRDTQLGELRAATRRPAAGGAAVVLAAGEPGIGTTRLVTEPAAGARARSWPGGPTPSRGAPPLWPWLQALTGRPERAALTTIGATPPPTHTADPGSATTLATAARTPAFDTVLDGLAASAAGTGLAVVLEDLHWADESTLRLLVLAAGRPGLAVVGTYRSTERGPALRAALTELRRHDGTRTLTLHPWTLDDVAAHLPAPHPPLVGAGPAAGRGRQPAAGRRPARDADRHPGGRHTLAFAAAANARHLVGFHHDPARTDEQLDALTRNPSWTGPEASPSRLPGRRTSSGWALVTWSAATRETVEWVGDRIRRQAGRPTLRAHLNGHQPPSMTRRRRRRYRTPRSRSSGSTGRALARSTASRRRPWRHAFS